MGCSGLYTPSGLVVQDVILRREDLRRTRYASVLKHFGSSTDPRVNRTRKHSLHDVLVLAICAFICGIDDWVNLEFFANTKLKWFKTFLELPNGVPSHDTFAKVFAALDPEAFAREALEFLAQQMAPAEPDRF